MTTSGRDVLGFLFLAAAVLANGSSSLAAETDWPCFRGPDRRGVSSDRGLPLRWSDEKNVVWKTRLPGPGASSPIVLGDLIYLACYSGYGVSREEPGRFEDLRRHAICVARQDGRILWDRPFDNETPDESYVDFVNLHGYASSAPAADETGVYFFFGTSGLRAYDRDGRLKWERSCGVRYDNFGSGASPVLFDDLVIVNAAIESNAIIALNKRDGREVWRVSLDGHSRSSPLVIDREGRPELVYHLGESHENGRPKASGLAAVDPRDGSFLWRCTSLDTYLNPSPIEADGVIYAIGCHPNRAVAIRAGGRGDVTATHKVWEIRGGSEVTTPLFLDGHLYWTNADSGTAWCVRAADGEVVYQERLTPESGRIYASPVAGDGKLYYVSREGGTYVLPAAPRFEILAHNVLASDATVFNGTPAISGGQLFLRSDAYLYCLDEE